MVQRAIVKITGPEVMDQVCAICIMHNFLLHMGLITSAIGKVE